MTGHNGMVLLIQRLSLSFLQRSKHFILLTHIKDNFLEILRGCHNYA